MKRAAVAITMLLAIGARAGNQAPPPPPRSLPPGYQTFQAPGGAATFHRPEFAPPPPHYDPAIAPIIRPSMTPNIYPQAMPTLPTLQAPTSPTLVRPPEPTPWWQTTGGMTGIAALIGAAAALIGALRGRS